MPELPEVEHVRRTLLPLVEGRVLTCFDPRDHLVLASPESEFQAFVGRRLTGIRRRGKYLLWRFEAVDPPVEGAAPGLMSVHLRMTGRFLLAPRKSPLHVHDRVVMCWEGIGDELRFRDIRRFGRLAVAASGEEADLPGVGRLGVEALDVSRDAFIELFRGRAVQAKAALLRQDLVAGLGNIYADEILFRVRLHPRRLLSTVGTRKLGQLHEAMRAILTEAVEKGGSTIRDFSDALGLDGGYQDVHLVYGKGGKPCPRCGRTIRKTVAAGRGTHYCPYCQKR